MPRGAVAAAAARAHPAATGAQLATLPPSATPKDEYDLAYGYVLRKDYALAEEAFRDFLSKYPERSAGCRTRNTGSAKACSSASAIATRRNPSSRSRPNIEHSGKAPDALLRLGQSLAALNQKEAACATLGEVGRKYPRAPPTVKHGVEREQKRVRC